MTGPDPPPDDAGEGPPDGAWRASAKAVVLDQAGRVLLLHMHDPLEPRLGTWWELPGGGPEPGEDVVAAVVRELAEEAGLVVPPGTVGPVCWRRRATYRWLGRRRWSDETVAVVRLPATVATVPVCVTDDESVSMLGRAWWTVDEVRRSDQTFYPRRLPELLPRVLAGEQIDEGYERWS